MVLLHTSDWHLGMSFRGRSSEEDQMHFIDQICSILIEKKVDALILAGDVFDKSIASSDAINLYDRIMTRIVGELGIPVLCIAGNHDGADRLSQCSRLLKKSGLYISGHLSKDFDVVELEDADIYLLPWFTQEKAKAVFPDEAKNINGLEDAYKVICQKIRDSFQPGRRHILVSHAYIANAVTSTSDRAAEIGFATRVSKDVFQGFDYVALGHIHKEQQVAPNIRYSGSPMPYSFGKEENQKKGVILIDTEDMSQEFIELSPLHVRITLRGEYEDLLHRDYIEDIRNGYVRLEVMDSYVGSEAMALFGERFPNLLEVKGKDFDRDDATITMTMDEFEEKIDDPLSIFKEYCKDVLKEIAPENRVDRFNKAIEEYTKEAQ